MASLNYDHFFYNVYENNIDLTSDTFYAMLVTSSYTPNQGTDNVKSDVTNEVTGTGYTAGGVATACTISIDTTNHRVDLTFAGVSWSSSTITARGIVIYQHTGTDSTSHLVAYGDFGSDKSDSGGTFAVTFDAPVRIQN